VRAAVIAGANNLGNHGRTEAQQVPIRLFGQSARQHSRIASSAARRPISKQAKYGKLHTWEHMVYNPRPSSAFGTSFARGSIAYRAIYTPLTPSSRACTARCFEPLSPTPPASISVLSCRRVSTIFEYEGRRTSVKLSGPVRQRVEDRVWGRFGGSGTCGGCWDWLTGLPKTGSTSELVLEPGLGPVAGQGLTLAARARLGFPR
jgi:hypothetical protein